MKVRRITNIEIERRIQVFPASPLPMEDERKSVQVLLGSGGIATMERKKMYRDLVSEHFSGCASVVFVPFASYDHSGYTSRMNDFLGTMGQRLQGLHETDFPHETISDADAIYVGGGNSFLLIRELHERALIEPIRDAVLNGTPYFGVSAGANMACPTMMTTNDMPIVRPPSFKSFGIVPFQINPHYHPGKIRFEDDGELVEPLLRAELYNHCSYGVPPEQFLLMFDVVRDEVEQALGPLWTSEMDHAWNQVLARLRALHAGFDAA